MDEPTASVVMPCWNSAEWVEEAVESVCRGTLRDFELLAVDDGSTDGTVEKLERLALKDGRVHVVKAAHEGVSATRNRGLALARGKYVFFLDPDDTFEPDFLAACVEALERDGADFCICAWNVVPAGGGEVRPEPLKGDYRIRGAEEIREGYLPRIFGYSMEQVEEWNRGKALWTDRELGSACRCGFRRETVERWNVRFDERLWLYEDAMFDCEFLLRAQAMTCVERPLYNYRRRDDGAASSGPGSPSAFRNKLELLRKRRELDAIAGGTLRTKYAASCVFSLLEMLRAAWKGLAPEEGLEIVREYAAAEEVRRAVAEFPCSWRHPLTAAAVMALRTIGAANAFRLLKRMVN